MPSRDERKLYQPMSDEATKQVFNAIQAANHRLNTIQEHLERQDEAMQKLMLSLFGEDGRGGAMMELALLTQQAKLNEIRKSQVFGACIAAVMSFFAACAVAVVTWIRTGK